MGVLVIVKISDGPDGAIRSERHNRRGVGESSGYGLVFAIGSDASQERGVPNIACQRASHKGDLTTWRTRDVVERNSRAVLEGKQHLAPPAISSHGGYAGAA